MWETKFLRGEEMLWKIFAELEKDVTIRSTLNILENIIVLYSKEKLQGSRKMRRGRENTL